MAKKVKKILGTSLKILCVLILVAGALVLWNFYDINTIAVNEYEIYSTKIPAGFNQYRIAFVSDFHNADYVEHTVDRLKAQKADIIVIGGDMVNLEEDSYDNTKALLKEIVKIAPVYMVTGNHEIFHDMLEEIKTDFENIGVKFLHDEGVKIYGDAGYIKLYGLKDPAVGDDELMDEGKLDAAVSKAEAGADVNTFSIMVMHRANMFDMVYDTGYDLILSGHIHGGVVRIPFIGGMFTPERDQYFPAYTKGMYTLGKSKMIVSAGMDKLADKPRVFNGPEIVMVTLKKG